MVFQNDRKEGFYPSADSVHDADSAYFRDDLDGFHMSASRSCCALPASMRVYAACYFGGGSCYRISGSGTDADIINANPRFPTTFFSATRRKDRIIRKKLSLLIIL